MRARTVALIGNPNCGKTSLFNALTGQSQRVGNWSGVTVDRFEGECQHADQRFHVIDLPGTYSLILGCAEIALDERITRDYLDQNNFDVVVNVVDASNLCRNLYLSLQLKEAGVPLIIALNMMDVAEKSGVRIDIDALAQRMGCPVVPVVATRPQSLDVLKKTILSYQAPEILAGLPEYLPAEAKQVCDALAIKVSGDDASPKTLMRWIEGDVLSWVHLDHHQRDLARQIIDRYERVQKHPFEVVIATARYDYLEQLLSQVAVRSEAVKTAFSEQVDRLVLHRLLGLPIFLGVMYLLFMVAISFGGVFQDFFSTLAKAGSDGVFYGIGEIIGASGFLAVLSEGFGLGISTTASFIPVIGGMFLGLALLEDSGYMARAAFVVDRFMQSVGLPGRSFVPLIIGFGCNVPAILGARSLNQRRDRILTIMMSPFMSCGARLAIYAAFVGVFFPQGGQNVVFILYLIGILTAMLTGALLSKTLLKGESAPMIMELPDYHLPTVSVVLRQTKRRLWSFISRAGRLIVPMCVLITALNLWQLPDKDGALEPAIAKVAHIVTPVFAPMGISQENWPATVGLATGIVAKEVVIGTLSGFYLHESVAVPTMPEKPQMLNLLESAWGGVLEKWEGLRAAVPSDTLDSGVRTAMAQHFDGRLGAMSYLIFVLLYFPCVSTTAAIARELGRQWAMFSVAWSTGLAYALAVVVYQVGSFFRHPWHSTIWILVLSAVFVASLRLMRQYAAKRHRQWARPLPLKVTLASR